MLGTESGAEGVNLAKTHCGHFALKLCRNGKTCLFAEEIVFVIFLFGFKIAFPAVCGNAEHFASTLAVTACYNRGLNVAVAVFVEIFVNGVSKLVTNCKKSLKIAGANTKVRNGAQELGGVALFLQRIIRGAGAKHGKAFAGNFIAVALRCNQGAANAKGGARHCGILQINFRFLINDNLNVCKAGAIVKLDKGNVFRISCRSYPAANGNLFANKLLCSFKKLANVNVFHLEFSPEKCCY